MFNSGTPIIGNLLLSEPFMLDANFERSVIFLCEHNEDGTVGLVLNHSSNLILSDVIPDIKHNRFPLFIGGPVENNILFFLHRAFDKIESGTHISGDIYWGGDFEKLIILINEGLIDNNEVKFFLGYAGWSSNQLNEELIQNSWAIHNSFDTDLVFLNDGEDLWKKALISLGPKYAHVAQFPKSPHLN